MPVARELSSTLSQAEELLAELNEVASIPVRLCVDVGHACAHGNTGPDREL